jgi:prepilin peptidase CpaA
LKDLYTVNSPFFVFLFAFVTLSICFDVIERRIPNWLNLIGIAGGFLFGAVKGAAHFFDSFLGFGLGIACFVIPFALGWLGAGDVKMLGAVGSLVGLKVFPRVFFYTALCGLCLGLASMAVRRMDFKGFRVLWTDLKTFVSSRGMILPQPVAERTTKGTHAVPYGVAIGLGTLIAFYMDPRGEWAGF